MQGITSAQQLRRQSHTFIPLRGRSEGRNISQMFTTSSPQRQGESPTQEQDYQHPVACNLVAERLRLHVPVPDTQKKHPTCFIVRFQHLLPHPRQRQRYLCFPQEVRNPACHLYRRPVMHLCGPYASPSPFSGFFVQLWASSQRKGTCLCCLFRTHRLTRIFFSATCLVGERWPGILQALNHNG